MLKKILPCLIISLLLFLNGCGNKQENKNPDSISQKNIHELIESSTNLTDEMKKQVLQISLDELAQPGSDLNVNGIEAFDLNGDKVKEILISFNYRKELDRYGQLRILFWNGQTYTSRILSKWDDVYGEKNFIVKKLANNENPQIITWWAGGNQAYLYVIAQVINSDNSFSTVWEKQGIIGGTVKIENDLIAIYSQGNLVQYYPAPVNGNQGQAILNTGINQSKEISTIDYFPLDKGITWKYTYPDQPNNSIYKTSFTPINVGGQTLYRIYFINSIDSREVNKGTVFYVIDKNGDILEISTISSLLGEVTYNIPHITFKNRIKIGDSWEYSDRGDKVTRTFKGFETITTKADKFTDCIKIEEVTATNQTKYYKMCYYALNTGLVKEMFVTSNKEESVLYELSYYKK